MKFLLIAVLVLWLGRRLGWAISRGFFYSAPVVLSIAGQIVWGIAVAWVISSLIAWQHPGPFPKWVFGFALGAYVAIPNFGLFIESSIPDTAQIRHTMVSTIPLLVYIGAQVAAHFKHP